jgi:acetyltransferase-like isoleucine patch superfamily enzyme
LLNNKWIQKFLIWTRHHLLSVRNFILRRIYGMNIHPTTRISLKAKLDRRNPAGVHIGEYSYVAFNAVILTHDMASNKKKDVYIGKYCFIGANSFILPGVTIGDHSIVGACALVTKDVPANSIVVGNPARVVKTGITTMRYGQMPNV